jgi:hypothetical protein
MAGMNGHHQPPKAETRPIPEGPFERLAMIFIYPVFSRIHDLHSTS